MKVIQIVPQEGLALYATLVKKEAELRKKNRGTFYRTAGKKRNSSKWRHRAYPGWLNLERGLSDVVLAEIHAPAPDQEWQLLSAFLGFIDRHFGNGCWPLPSTTADAGALPSWSALSRWLNGQPLTPCLA